MVVVPAPATQLRSRRGRESFIRTTMRYDYIYRTLWHEAIDVMDKVGYGCVNNCHNGATGPALDGRATS